MQKQRLCRKSVIGNFAEFTRKNLCRNLFFDEVKLCRIATSLTTRVKKGSPGKI